MGEATTIRGALKLEWRDQWRSLSRRLIPIWLGLALVLILMLGAAWLSTLSPAASASLRGKPFKALHEFIANAGLYYLAVMALAALVMVGPHAYAFWRFPDANRRLTFEVNEEHIVTRDAAGFSLSVPWRDVTQIRDTPNYLRYRLSTRVWRILYWRAFAPEDRESIRRWARSRESVER